MSDFSYSISNTERGPMYGFRLGDRTTYLLGSKALTDHRTIGPAMQALADGFATVGEILQARTADLTPTGFTRLAAEVIKAHVNAPFNRMKAAIIEATAEIEKRRESFDAPYFTADQPPAVRVELRQYAKSRSLPALMELTQSDAVMAGAIVEGGPSMSGLPADIFERLKRDVAVANATRVLLGQRSYRTVPNASDPIGGKPDLEAAHAAGEGLIAALEAEALLLAGAPATLAAGIDIVAILTDATRDDAFARLAA
jgi:hypothetical protein